MKRFLTLALASALVASAQAQPAIEPDPDLPGLGNRLDKLEWLQDAGFGMFIHFSHDAQLGSVISHSMVGASESYREWFIEELPKSFNPDRWDPDALADLAKLAGMRYVVFTTKHHVGFTWWDSDTTDFKITNTPYGKDVLYDYARALRQRGLAVGFYYSPEDFSWLHRNGHPVRRRNLEPHPDEDAEYKKFIAAQVTELYTNYGPVDMLFIDGEGETETKRVAWTLQPETLITRGAMETPEQFVPGRPPEGPWEANLTMGTQWSYKPTNDRYKSGRRIIEVLIETRAKGGSLLLNVGPKPNGELPIEQEARLREVALWHAANGESVHSTRPWVVPREGNIWFTKQKDADTLYVHLTGQGEWPRGERREFVLRSVKATGTTKISVLGHDGVTVEYMPEVDGRHRFRSTDEGLELSVVRAQRLYNDHKWANPVVVKLEDVKPAITTPPYAETGEATATGSGSLHLTGRLVETGDADEVRVGFEYQVYEGFAEAMYNTEWTPLPLQDMSSTGEFSADLDGLEPGGEYQFRAVVHDPKITVHGDHVIVSAP